jgi:two-component system, NtrC family, sensor kinase
MRIQQVSLQLKIITATSGIIIFLLLFSTYLNLQFLRKSLEDSLADTAILLARQIDTTIESKRRLEDPALLKREVSDLVQMRRHIRNIDIYLFIELTEKNRSSELKERYRVIIASDTIAIVPLSENEIKKLKQNETSSRTITDRLSSRILVVIAPLHLHQRVIGAISIQSTFDEMDKLLLQQQRQSYFITFITLLVIVPLLAYYLHRTVNRPIQMLVRAMGEVETNQLPAAVKITRKDELGYLGENFNRMVNRLAEVERERQQLLSQVQQFNIELQDKVRETTGELERQNEMLQRAHSLLVTLIRRQIDAEKLATLGQVAATIAHEVGTPLGAISGHIQLLREQYQNDTATIERIDIIEKQLTRVVNIIQNLLISVRERTAEFTPVSINHLIREIITLISPQLIQQRILMKPQLADNLPNITGSADQLQQVFLNLINNAMDAMPHGGELILRTSYQVMPIKLLLVEIIDSGTGIGPEHLPYIFDPFYSTKGPGEGTGLGLSVCKDIVERHNGIISVTSQLNQGTKFMIQFPVKEKLETRS